MPLFFFLQRLNRQAAAAGLAVKQPHGRSFWANVKFYIIEFDAIGIFLVCAGMVIFLLPFSIASTYASSFASAEVISMIVVGIVCLALFVLWERFCAPLPFVPWRLLSNRTVLGACILDFSWQIAYYW